MAIFWPQGDIEYYAGAQLPNPADYPVGTWAYDRQRALSTSGWLQLVQYTMPKQIAWEAYDTDAPSLKHVTKLMKMTALVMA